MRLKKRPERHESTALRLRGSSEVCRRDWDECPQEERAKSRREIAQKPNGQDSREKRMTNEFNAATGAAQPDR